MHHRWIAESNHQRTGQRHAEIAEVEGKLDKRGLNRAHLEDLFEHLHQWIGQVVGDGPPQEATRQQHKAMTGFFSCKTSIASGFHTHSFYTPRQQKDEVAGRLVAWLIWVNVSIPGRRFGSCDTGMFLLFFYAVTNMACSGKPGAKTRRTEHLTYIPSHFALFRWLLRKTQ